MIDAKSRNEGGGTSLADSRISNLESDLARGKRELRDFVGFIDARNTSRDGFAFSC